MDSLVLQSKVSSPDSEHFLASYQNPSGYEGITTYRKWPSSVLPTEEIDIEGLLSQYRTSIDLGIQDLKNQITLLTGQVIIQSQIIQDLQKKRIVPIQNLRSSKLRLKEPLYISIEYGNGVYVAFSDDLNLYGQGETELNAIRDFCKEVKSLYLDFKKSKDKLGKVMEENWQFLKGVIKEL